MKKYISAVKKIYSLTSSSRYIKYLREKGVTIGENTLILDPFKSNIDNIRTRYIKIGNNCIICSGVSIIAHDYSWSILRKSHNDILPAGGGEIIIGDNCFIGVGSTILQNVTIGDNVIVGAGSVVTKSIPSNSVCAGNPAKVIMSLDDYYERRKQQILTDARTNVKLIAKVKNRLPKVSECLDFLVLFLPRTESNINSFVKPLNKMGDTNAEYIDTFKNIKPIYPDFDTFLLDMLGEKNYIYYKNKS